MHKGFFLTLLGILVFLALNVVAWQRVSRRHYVLRPLGPGEPYQVGDREYRMPDLPVSGEKPYPLKPEFLEAIEELLGDVLVTLQAAEVPHWLSGGTLLGFERHGCPMPWDDDLDLHVPWSAREFLFSPAFAALAAEHGLEAFFLKGMASLQRATREGAALRLRRRGTTTPVCDVFFTQTAGGRVRKVDSWGPKGATLSAREDWAEADVFPIKTGPFGRHAAVPVPQRPRAVLQQQYGPRALEEIVVRSTWFSHQYPYEVLSWFGITKSGGETGVPGQA